MQHDPLLEPVRVEPRDDLALARLAGFLLDDRRERQRLLRRIHSDSRRALGPQLGERALHRRLHPQ